MIKLVKRIYRGACWSEKYGSHPGTYFMIMMIIMGAVAGASKGSWAGALGGGLFMALFIVPIWLIGCYGRGE